MARGKYKKVVEVPYTFRDRELGASKFGQREVVQYLQQLGQVARDKIFKRAAAARRSPRSSRAKARRPWSAYPRAGASRPCGVCCDRQRTLSLGASSSTTARSASVARTRGAQWIVGRATGGISMTGAEHVPSTGPVTTVRPARSSWACRRGVVARHRCDVTMPGSSPRITHSSTRCVRRAGDFSLSTIAAPLCATSCEDCVAATRCCCSGGRSRAGPCRSPVAAYESLASWSRSVGAHRAACAADADRAGGRTRSGVSARVRPSTREATGSTRERQTLRVAAASSLFPDISATWSRSASAPRSPRRRPECRTYVMRR